MNRHEELREATQAVVAVLSMPRDRLGRLVASTPEALVAREKLRALAVKYNVGSAQDQIEQAARVLAAVLAREDDEVNQGAK